MRLWLDDIRVPPCGYDLWAKNYDECIRLLETNPVSHVSLDHDLAQEHYAEDAGYSIQRSPFKEKTGYDVLLWMAGNQKWVNDIIVHSMNSSGRADMIRFLRRHAPEGVSFSEKPYVVFGT